MPRAQIIKNFQQLNRTRIVRLRELAPLHQQPFFELLPLIFHANSDDLPGYINKNTPAGIANYQPNDAEINAAKILNHSFNYKRRALRHYPILGLYLINDNGIINYPDEAKFDLWLVHGDSVPESYQLEQKLTAIQKWAKTLGITLHTKLVNVALLPQQDISAYNLNRLYLNGLILAGNAPLWWAIPPEDEADYQKSSQSLAQKGQLAHTSIIDFGPLSPISPQSIFNELCSRLIDAEDKGLEPALELLFLQQLLDNYPNTQWLSHDLKHALYQSKKDSLQLDCNNLKLQSLTNQLNSDDEVLLLAQQSFYVLAKERVSQQVKRPRHPWRRNFIEQQVELWQWAEENLLQLDDRYQSHYRQCFSEYTLMAELHSNISRSLTKFAQQHQLDIGPLKQKQRLFYNDSLDIITRLPSSLLPVNSEDYLYLHRFNPNDGWSISDTLLNSIKDQALYKNDSLLQVIAWAINNRLLSQSSRLKIADQTNQTTINTVVQLVQHLLHSPFVESDETPSEEILKESATIEKIMLFINLEHSPQDNLSLQGLALSSLQSDSFNYAVNKQSQVLSVEGLIYSSWGQWHYFLHTGTTSPLQMINTVTRWNPSKASTELVSCWCPSESHGQAISNRMSKLYSDVITHYKSNPQRGDYLIELADHRYRIQWQPGSSDFSLLPKRYNVADILATPKTEFSTSKIDSHLDSNQLFEHLLRHQSPDQITLFLHFKDKIITIYILDELGTLIKQKFTDLTESTLTTHFHRFLRTIKSKNKVHNLRFYRLVKMKSKGWKLNAIPLANMPQQEYLPVTIEMASPANNAHCTLQCGPQQYSGIANDPALFQQIRKFVLSLRKTNNHYPLYITELSFQHDKQYPTHQYITQKKKLEHLLNST